MPFLATEPLSLDRRWADYRIFKYERYNVCPRVCGHLIVTPVWACWTSYSKTMGITIEFPHQAPNSLHSSRKILELSLWNLGLFSLRSPALQSTFQIIPRVFGRLGVRPLWLRPLEFLHTNLIKRCLYEAGFVHKGTVMLQQKRTYPKLVPQGWKYRIV